MESCLRVHFDLAVFRQYNIFETPPYYVIEMGYIFIADSILLIQLRFFYLTIINIYVSISYYNKQCHYRHPCVCLYLTSTCLSVNDTHRHTCMNEHTYIQERNSHRASLWEYYQIVFLKTPVNRWYQVKVPIVLRPSQYLVLSFLFWSLPCTGTVPHFLFIYMHSHKHVGTLRFHWICDKFVENLWL